MTAKTLEISIFAKPRKMSPEVWNETIAEVICDAYGVFGDEPVIKKALFDATSSSEIVTYKSFITELKKVKQDEEYDPYSLADMICPMYLKKNEWTSAFDTKDGKPLEGMSAKSLRTALKDSCDKNFSYFIMMLWLRVNLPELYDLLPPEPPMPPM